MILYNYVDHYIRSLKEIRFFYWLSQAIIDKEVYKRTSSWSNRKENNLANKRNFFEELFKKRKETWSENKEKNFLLKIRIAYIIKLVKERYLYGKR